MSPLLITIIIPLCDAKLIDCGARALGDPHSLTGNLYWGAAFGAEYYLRRAAGYKTERTKDDPRAHVLRELVLSRQGRHPLQIRMLAYDDIDVALNDFFQQTATGTGGDLLIWAGHDRLMDVSPPEVTPGVGGQRVAVLACMSERFYGPALARLGARPLAMTRTLMAPEAYLLEGMLNAVAEHGLDAKLQVRHALVDAYAKFQHLSTGAASSVFSKIE